MFLEWWMTGPVWAPSGEGDGGDGGDDGDDGDEDGGGTRDGGDDGGSSWWKDSKRFSEDQQSSLAAHGLTVEDPLEAVTKLLDMEAAAKKRLGASPDQLMQKPTEGQDVAEWLKENGAVFGIPDNAEGYEVAKPEDWPKDADWDADFETKAREIAHQNGVPQGAFQAMVGLYAQKVASLNESADSQLSTSTAQLMKELQTDWGAQTPAKVAQAQQAFQLIATEAGLTDEARMAAAAVLTEKAGGDANVLRLFAQIGEMAGEDSLVGLTNGAGQLTTTPADARAKIEAMKREGSEYRSQMRLKRQGKPNTFAELHKEFLALQEIAAGD